MVMMSNGYLNINSPPLPPYHNNYTASTTLNPYVNYTNSYVNSSVAAIGRISELHADHGYISSLRYPRVAFDIRSADEVRTRGIFDLRKIFNKSSEVAFIAERVGRPELYGNSLWYAVRIVHAGNAAQGEAEVVTSRQTFGFLKSSKLGDIFFGGSLLEQPDATLTLRSCSDILRPGDRVHFIAISQPNPVGFCKYKAVHLQPLPTFSDPLKPSIGIVQDVESGSGSLWCSGLGKVTFTRESFSRRDLASCQFTLWKLLHVGDRVTFTANWVGSTPATKRLEATYIEKGELIDIEQAINASLKRISKPLPSVPIIPSVTLSATAPAFIDPKLSSLDYLSLPPAMDILSIAAAGAVSEHAASTTTTQTSAAAGVQVYGGSGRPYVGVSKVDEGRLARRGNAKHGIGLVGNMLGPYGYIWSETFGRIFFHLEHYTGDYRSFVNTFRPMQPVEFWAISNHDTQKRKTNSTAKQPSCAWKAIDLVVLDRKADDVLGYHNLVNGRGVVANVGKTHGYINVAVRGGEEVVTIFFNSSDFPKRHESLDQVVSKGQKMQVVGHQTEIPNSNRLGWRALCFPESLNVELDARLAELDEQAMAAVAAAASTSSVSNLDENENVVGTMIGNGASGDGLMSIGRTESDCHLQPFFGSHDGSSGNSVISSEHPLESEVDFGPRTASTPPVSLAKTFSDSSMTPTNALLTGLMNGTSSSSQLNHHNQSSVTSVGSLTTTNGKRSPNGSSPWNPSPYETMLRHSSAAVDSSMNFYRSLGGFQSSSDVMSGQSDESGFAQILNSSSLSTLPTSSDGLFRSYVHNDSLFSNSQLSSPASVQTPHSDSRMTTNSGGYISIPLPMSKTDVSTGSSSIAPLTTNFQSFMVSDSPNLNSITSTLNHIQPHNPTVTTTTTGTAMYSSTNPISQGLMPFMSGTDSIWRPIALENHSFNGTSTPTNRNIVVDTAVQTDAIMERDLLATAIADEEIGPLILMRYPRIAQKYLAWVSSPLGAAKLK